MRKTEFRSGEYCHIYNRGVDKREVFLGEGDYIRFLKSIKEFNVSRAIGSLKDLQALRARSADGLLEPVNRVVDIICYCLNPNHYHFILRQIEDRVIEKFMHKLGMGYTNYFNKKHNRSGSLFQEPFKSIHIDSNKYLLHLSVYVNANHTIHNYPEKDWPYSSYLDYTGKREGRLCEKETILGQFDSNLKAYERFMQNNINYFREKKELEEYVLE